MKRLLDRGLMRGGLMAVSSPALVARYNRALRHLTGRESSLAEFHLDISGYAPEIAAEFGDDDYLGAVDGLRPFILLSTSQRHAPLLRGPSSRAASILRQFIDANAAALLAVTCRDVIAGRLELVEPDPALPLAMLAALPVARVSAEQIGPHPRDAEALTRLVERFQAEPEGWRDDRLASEMIAAAKPLGAVSVLPLALPKLCFAEPSYWTPAFGGLYMLARPEPVAMIFRSPPPEGGATSGLVLRLEDRKALAAWLMRNALVESIATRRDAATAARINQKMDFILVAEADRLGLNLSGARRADLRGLALRLGAGLPRAYQGLAEVLRWAEGRGSWPVIGADHPAYFYLLRARVGPERALVTMLLCDLSPLDLRQLFIGHKPRFLQLYAGWSAAKRETVCHFLAEEYRLDRQGARTALFGPEPEMDLPPHSAVSGAEAVTGLGGRPGKDWTGHRGGR